MSSAGFSWMTIASFCVALLPWLLDFPGLFGERMCWKGFLPQWASPLPVLVAVPGLDQAPVGFGVASIPSLASSSPARAASSQPRPVVSQVLTAANKWCDSDVSPSLNKGEEWSSAGPAECVLSLSPPPHQSHCPSFCPQQMGTGWWLY